MLKNIVNTILNNGWRRISSLKDNEKEASYFQLPKQYYEYDIIVEGEIIYRYYYGGSISDDGYVKVNVTHFRFSEIHKLPKK